MTRRTPRSSPDRADRSQLRIIGGRWRGRRIEFRAEPGLRPTPDRVRETLFNWLQPAIADSRCLDLFCGSGALAIEALSRGAAAATLVDVSARVLREVRQNLERLGASGFELVCADACEWLRTVPGRRYDIVFVDPPFGAGSAQRCVQLLGAADLLAPGARVYVEAGAGEAAPELPPGWALHREKFAGQVAYRLYRVEEQRTGTEP
jgi:16S rRNA (guanine966-N2)-methyltransferase